jgi:hypothetical protein
MKTLIFLLIAATASIAALPDKVICPECAKSGKQSKCRADGIVITTCMGWTPVTYDENGKATYHKDPNKRIYTFRCSNNHSFGVEDK